MRLQNFKMTIYLLWLMTRKRHVGPVASQKVIVHWRNASNPLKIILILRIYSWFFSAGNLEFNEKNGFFLFQILFWFDLNISPLWYETDVKCRASLDLSETAFLSATFLFFSGHLLLIFICLSVKLMFMFGIIWRTRWDVIFKCTIYV